MRPLLRILALAWAVLHGATAGPASAAGEAPAAGAGARLEVRAPAGADAARSPTEAVSPPDFAFRTGPLPEGLWRRMQGTSWHASVSCAGRVRRCPAREDLVLVTTRHWDLAGRPQVGRLVVARDAAGPFRELLEAWWRQRFPIARMEPVSTFGGSDARSMAANNTSAFNCRCTTGGTQLSTHASGRTIDVNPVQNPFVTGERVLPAEGRPFADRARIRPGMLAPGSCALRAARRAGFAWGGHWRRSKDWQHLELGEVGRAAGAASACAHGGELAPSP